MQCNQLKTISFNLTHGIIDQALCSAQHSSTGCALLQRRRRVRAIAIRDWRRNHNIGAGDDLFSMGAFARNRVVPLDAQLGFAAKHGVTERLLSGSAKTEEGAVAGGLATVGVDVFDIDRHRRKRRRKPIRRGKRNCVVDRAKKRTAALVRGVAFEAIGARAAAAATTVAATGAIGATWYTLGCALAIGVAHAVGAGAALTTTAVVATLFAVAVGHAQRFATAGRRAG